MDTQTQWKNKLTALQLELDDMENILRNARTRHQELYDVLNACQPGQTPQTAQAILLGVQRLRLSWPVLRRWIQRNSSTVTSVAELTAIQRLINLMHVADGDYMPDNATPHALSVQCELQALLNDEKGGQE